MGFLRNGSEEEARTGKRARKRREKICRFGILGLEKGERET